MVGTNLIPGLFYDHKLCFKYPNGSCNPILNIYISRAFRWYKELFNLMSFDSCNCLLKIQKSIGILIPEVRAHLGVCGFIPSHSLTFSGTWNVTPRLHSWPAPLQALALVMNPKLRLQQISLPRKGILVDRSLEESSLKK
jgi:hypothetical protein